MANVTLLKQRLSALQSKSSSSGRKEDYKKNYWKPPVGKCQIRILPNKFDKENPFSEVLIHYGIGKSKMSALTNFENEKDPIIEFAQQIRKEDWKLAKKIEPKLRIFAQVIVRGEEELGPRLWEFGKEIYQELLGIMADEDYGDITDITKGRDITIETLSPEDTGKKYNTSTIRVKPKESPISEDSKLVKSLITEQKNILELLPKYGYDEMKGILKEYLQNIEDGEEETSTPAPTKTPQKFEKSDTVKGKKETPKSEDFDELFDDNDEEDED